MRILYLHQYYCPEEGWGNDRSRFFATYWAQRGHQVTVLTTTAYFPPSHPAHQKIFSQTVDKNGVLLLVLRIPYAQQMPYLQKVGVFLLFFLGGLWAGLRISRLDVIYASSTPPTVGQMGLWLSRFHKCRFIFETVDVWPDVPIGMGIIKNRLLKKGLHFLVNNLYRKAGKIIALSEGMKAQIRTHNVPSEKIIVNHNGTDTELFTPRLKKDSNPHAPLIIIYIGAFGKANDVHFLLQALRKLQQEKEDQEQKICPEFELHLYGWGAETETLKMTAKNWQLTNVHFFDPLPKKDLSEKLRQADIGVVTFAPYSVLEANSANKFYDYLACGLPVITNYQGWQAEYLNQFQCGLSSVQGDLELFTRNLKRLLSDQKMRLEMGVRARELAEKHFDRRTKAEEVLLQLT